MSTYAAGVPASEVHLRRAVLLACSAAAAIHFGATHAHLMEYQPAGYFMLLSGAAQLLWAVWIVDGASNKVVAVGVAGNAAVVALWVASRTMGLPFGEHPWMPERIHPTDALCTALEVVVVLASVALLRPDLRLPTRWFTALAATGASLSVLVSSDEPGRERTVAVATLLLVASTPALVVSIRRSFAVPSVGRNHVQVPFIDRFPAVLDAPARATIGARG